MTLRYILGSVGTGKTLYCINEMTKTNKNEKCIYITPEQYTVESEKNLVKASENGVTMQSEVLSFARLAYHVFSVCGYSSKEILDDLGKNMLLRKIIYDLKDELVYFGKNSDKNGFVEGLSDTLKEFVKYRLSTNILTDIAKKTDRKSLGLKLQDLCLIADKFEENISEKYVNSEETLDVLANKIEQGLCDDYFSNCNIYLDCFYGFTPQEFNVIDKLMTKVKSINIAIWSSNIDVYSQENGVYYDKISMNNTSAHIKYTINDITNLARKNNVKMLEPITLKENHRHKNAIDLKFLADNYLKYLPDEKINCENIKIVQTVNPHDEIQLIARKITLLIKEKGYRYRDIAIVGNGLSEIELIFEHIFNAYNIPFFIDVANDIVVHPLVDFVRNAINIIVSNWSYDSVFGLLKTGLMPIPLYEIDRLENYVLKYGIKGASSYKKPWKGFKTDDKPNSYMDKINNSREILTELISVLGSNKKYTVEEISTKIFELIDKADVTRKLDILSYSDDGFEKDNIHMKVWNKIVDLFDKIVDVIGNEQVTYKEFLGILESGLETIELGNIPPTLDEVIVGEIERSRFPEVKALFIVGANNGNLPRKYVEKGFLTDEDRESMLDSGILLSPTIHSLILRQQFLIYTALTKPSELLHISYTQNDIAGNTLDKSPIIRKIRNLYNNLEVEEIGDLNKLNYEDFLGIKEPIFTKITSFVRNRDDIENNYEEVYNYFKNHDRYSERLLKIERFYESRHEYDELSKELADSMYGSEISTGVSRLEMYAQCPFMYFATYDLKLKEREIYELKPFDIGDIFHEVLEKYIEEFSKNDEKTDISPNNISYDEDVINQVIDRVLNDVKDSIFTKAGSYDYIGKRLKKIATKSIWALCNHLQQGTFKIHAQEYDFTKNNPITGIDIKINNEQSFVLRGRIDRVDLLDKDDNKYVKIIDYKSGKKKMDYSDIYFGMQLQLITYLNSFIKIANNFNGANKLSAKFMPGGVFYFNLNTPVINENKLKGTDGKTIKEEVESLILEEFKLEGLMLKDVDIVKAMDKDISGKSKIIPADLKEKDGEETLSDKNSALLEMDEFEKLGNFITGKISGIGEELVSGRINQKPYKKGKQTGCDFCGYSSLCGFETLEVDNKYNIVKTIKGIDEIIDD